jgi:dipeptidyl-peptidase-4
MANLVRPKLLWIVPHLRLLLFAVPLMLPGARKPVTIDAVMAVEPAPPAKAIWSPDGSSYAVASRDKLTLHRLNPKGETVLADLKELSGKAITVKTAGPFDWENRRVTEQPLQWSADGRTLLVLNSGDLFLIDVARNQTRQLTATGFAERDPKLSPDGKMVSYRRDHDLYTLNIASGKITRLTTDGTPTRMNAKLDWVYPEELGIGTAHWWSPDNRWIAYLQFEVGDVSVYSHVDYSKVEGQSEPERYPKAGTKGSTVRFGIVPAAGGKTRWIDLGRSEEYLFARFYWTAARVLVTRLNRVQNHLDLLSVDPQSGNVETVLTEDDPYWINLSDDFHLLADGKTFLWSNESTGFRHLYLRSLAGAPPRQLTSGEWEVSELACVDERARQVYYTSTEASPLERQFYAVSFDGGDRRRISRKAGTHTVSMAPNCAVYLDSYSSLTSPPERTLHAADGTQLEVVRPANTKPLEEYEILPTELHQVKGPDGTLFHARLMKPAGFSPTKKYPAVVMIYGGPHAQTVRNLWGGLNWDQILAHQGFVIWQLDNRGSAGRGHLWESKVYRQFGKQELADQLTGLDYLTKLGFVDASRVGMYGWSYGGYMTLYSLFHAPDKFAAGISGAPVTDWRLYDTIYTERYMGLPQQNETGYKSSSPVHAAANLKAKLLLVHNIGDDNVLFQNGMMMMNALQLAGKPFETMLYPQKAHGVTGPARRHLLETTTSFLVRTLKP